MKRLWKTIVVVWSDFNPKNIETSDLVEEAETGSEALITHDSTKLIENPELDEHYSQDLEEFFLVDDLEDDGGSP